MRLNLNPEIQAIAKTSPLVSFLDEHLNIYQETNCEIVKKQKEKTLADYLTAKNKKWITLHKKYIYL